MSAALPLPVFWGTSNSQVARQDDRRAWEEEPAARCEPKAAAKVAADEPEISLAFYRKHTESMLRRYLYASMQIGRAPSILGEPIARGWASCGRICTPPDAVIFVLDVETCLNQMGSLDRQLLCRIVIQEYTQAEAATLLGMSVRTISYKFPLAVDRLTQKLLKTGLLVLPH